MVNMKKEDRELLIKDISARIPYNLKVAVKAKNEFINILCGIDINGYCDVNEDFYNIDNIKPYLFPMSSMTEEQEIEFKNTCNGYCEYYWTEETFDWLNKNHFDYRGLIPKNLANDATGLDIY